MKPVSQAQSKSPPWWKFGYVWLLISGPAAGVAFDLPDLEARVSIGADNASRWRTLTRITLPAIVRPAFTMGGQDSSPVSNSDR